MGFDTPVTAKQGTKIWNTHIHFEGKTTAAFILVGEFRVVDSTVLADYTTDFGVNNQHLCLKVNTMTGAGGTVTITGDSVDEGGAGVTAADTETITVDTAGGQRYQSDKKWLKVTNIDAIVTGITAIDYDIETCGYQDMGNEDFTILGFRLDVLCGAFACDLGMRIRKIQDDGSKKMSVVEFENIEFESQNADGDITDNFRTAGNDRSYNYGIRMANDGELVCLKMTDYSTFFSGDENVFEGSTKAEGFIIDFFGASGGGITSIDGAHLTVYYSQP